MCEKWIRPFVPTICPLRRIGFWCLGFLHRQSGPGGGMLTCFTSFSSTLTRMFFIGLSWKNSLGVRHGPHTLAHGFTLKCRFSTSMTGGQSSP